MSAYKIKTSKLIKKMGITFVIPIFMLIVGVGIMLTSAWSLITETMTLGSLVFARPSVHFEERTFEINNKAVYRPAIGDNFGRLKIPSVELDKPVIHGDDDDSLKQGVGHYAGSTIPGEQGNVVLSGHTNTVFRPLEYVNIGDEVILEVEYGTYKYKVKDIVIVDEEDPEYVITEVVDYERLTLYTCYPFNTLGRAPQRYVVICEFVESI